ncbi:hypothetical protein Tco_0552243 [Tanacetum coccineum]
MIACVEKTAQNADFYQIIDYLTGCSINYSLLVDPDLIGPWLQQFWATASLRVINEVPHIRATVAGKKILISEATIRADLLFDDADGVDCFPKQVIWDSLRDIGYEGNLAQLTFSKPLFSPQWKYLVHVLLHCLSPKSTSWEQFGQKHRHLLLRSFTHWCRGGTISNSPHSRAASSARDAQGTPTQSAAQASLSQGTAEVQGTDNSHGTANLQGTAASQGTASLQGTAASQGTAAIPKSPNDYTPTDASQTSGGDEGLLDLYALNREVRRLKKQTLSQAKQIHKLKTKLKKLSKFVQPVVKHHAFWVESQNLKKRRKKQKQQKKQKKKVSSVKLGRNKEEGEEASNVKSGDTEELDLETVQSTARQRVLSYSELNFGNEAGGSLERIKAEWDADEEERKKDLYDKVQRNLLKTPSKIVIPMDSEREKQLLKERDEKRLLRKRKATIFEEQPSRRLKLEQETIVELRNYLRIVTLKNAQDSDVTRRNLHDLQKYKGSTTIWVTAEISDVTSGRTKKFVEFLKEDIPYQRVDVKDVGSWMEVEDEKLR